MAKIDVSSTIDAPVAAVWEKIRDFNGLPAWHPAIAGSTIENGEPSDKVGCIRNLTLKSGDTIRERLLALSDLDYYFTYSILESPMLLRNYVARLQLQPIADGDRTYARWTATFECNPEEEADLISGIGRGVFQTGFASLKQIFPPS